MSGKRRCQRLHDKLPPKEAFFVVFSIIYGILRRYTVNEAASPSALLPHTPHPSEYCFLLVFRHIIVRIYHTRANEGRNSK